MRGRVDFLPSQCVCVGGEGPALARTAGTLSPTCRHPQPGRRHVRCAGARHRGSRPLGRLGARCGHPGDDCAHGAPRRPPRPAHKCAQHLFTRSRVGRCSAFSTPPARQRPSPLRPPSRSPRTRRRSSGRSERSAAPSCAGWNSSGALSFEARAHMVRDHPS